MNKHILSLLVLLFTFSASAQKLEKIIEKHLKAHGGTEKWDAVKAIKATGKFTAFSVEKDFYSIKTNKGKFYSKHHLGKYEVEEAFDGTKGWTIDPWQELGFPRGLNKTEVGVFLQKADFFSPFYHHKERGYTVELQGDEDVDGTPAYAIKVKRPLGTEEIWYLNKKTYLPVKCVSTWVDFAYPSKAETFFDDFQTIDGLVIPFYIERTFSQRNRVMIIENIEVNPTVDDKLFCFPKEEAIRKLDFLNGKWDVQVEMLMRGRWIPIDKTTSAVKFASENMLEEKISYDMFFPNEKIIQYSFNKKAEQYVVSVYNSFGSSLDVFVGKYEGKNLILTQKVMVGEENANTRLYFSKIEEGGFVLELQHTKDEGKTWTSAERFSYTKK